MTEPSVFYSMFVAMNTSAGMLRAVLILLWLCQLLVLWQTIGLTYAIDTARFEEEATAWLHGDVHLSYHLWYTGYVFLLFISKWIFGSIYYSMLFQCVFSFVALIAFFNGVARLFQNRFIAFASCLPLILYYHIELWNVYLLTESIFISLVLLFVWAFSLTNKRKSWICMLFIAVALSIVRPNGGIWLLICAYLYIAECWNSERTKALYLLSGFLLMIIPLMVWMLQYGTDVFLTFLIQSFQKGEIICGYTGWTVPIHYIGSNTPKGSVSTIIELIISFPSEYARLGLYRFIALWTDLRPYYSTTHNYYILVSLFCMYGSALIGMFYYAKKYRMLFLLTILYCGFNSILVMITYADWDGRFLAPLLPMICLWSGAGCYQCLSYWKRFEKSH